MPPTTAPRVGQSAPPAPPASSAAPPAPPTVGFPSGQAHSGRPGGPVAPFPLQRPGTAGRLPSPEAPMPAPLERPDGPADAGPGDPDDSGEPADSDAWALVTACQAGDTAAFSALFDRYYDVVFRYVLFRMGDRNLAEDISQETFVRALRRIGSVNYQGKDIGAWFVTIARNLIFDHVKSSRYRLESTTADIVELSPSTGGPEQQVLDGATNDELLRCVGKLNPDQQECIRLRFLRGLSVAETARMMDRNEGAVKALQHRAVRRLAQLLPEGIR